MQHNKKWRFQRKHFNSVKCKSQNEMSICICKYFRGTQNCRWHYSGMLMAVTATAYCHQQLWVLPNYCQKPNTAINSTGYRRNICNVVKQNSYRRGPHCCWLSNKECSNGVRKTTRTGCHEKFWLQNCSWLGNGDWPSFLDRSPSTPPQLEQQQMQLLVG